MHPGLAIMIEIESGAPMITMNSDGPIALETAYLVNTGNGKRVSPQCRVNIIGPVTLVRSRFEHLYFIVQANKCTCHRGRATGQCPHIEQASTPVVREDDLLQHIEDDLIVNRIVDGRFVPIHWNELTSEERRTAYQNDFDPCAIGGVA
jgi:hypothetical protein